MREMVLVGRDALAALRQVAHTSLQQAESDAPWHGTCERERSVQKYSHLCVFFPPIKRNTDLKDPNHLHPIFQVEMGPSGVPPPCP